MSGEQSKEVIRRLKELDENLSHIETVLATPAKRKMIRNAESKVPQRLNLALWQVEAVLALLEGNESKFKYDSGQVEWKKQCHKL